MNMVSSLAQVGGHRAMTPRVDDPDLLAQFFEMLQALTSAGVPITKALDGLSQHPGLERPLEVVVEALRSGKSISRAFALGGFSDPMVVGLLGLGERTGTLDKVTCQLAGLFRARSQLKAELKGKLTYPLILASACSLLVGLGPPLLLRPILDFLTSSGAPLPVATLALLALVQVLSSPWFWVLSPLVLWSVVVGSRSLRQQAPGQTEAWMLRRRGLGLCMRLLYSVRFGRALLSALASGFPLLAAVELAARCSGSFLVQEEAKRVCSSLMAGDAVETVFAHFQCLDPLLVRTIPLGLASGAVEPLLGAVLRLTEDRLHHATEAALALLEPLLLSFMGALVALSILATVAPMMSLLQGVM